MPSAAVKSFTYLGLMLPGLRCRVKSEGARVNQGIRMQDLGFRVPGSGFRVPGLGLKA